ncbi:MAG: isochorismatase family protein [Bacteroidales bacterium]|nr:isochorismatase family protein [Bacteroidales bacterium]
MKKLIMILGIAGLLTACNSSDKEAQNGEFKYLVDEFADLKVMRYQIPGWDELTLQQKEYIYYLGEAAKCGRDILADQNFKYNLTVRKTLEAILNSYKGDIKCADYQNFVVYAKRVFFSNGIHHHYAEDKMFPEISQEYFAQLVKNSDPKLLPLAEGESVDDFLNFITPVIFDKDLYAMRRSSEEDIIQNSCVNFYKGNINKGEVEVFYDAQRKPNDPEPISYGLNSKLVKENGKLHEEVYKADGLYGKAIQQIIYWLKKANEVAENDSQRNYTNLLIDYYTTGCLKTWDEYNIAWVEDSISNIDFVNGFIEDYNDPMGMKATWEAIVDYKDMEATKRSEIISANAQWFEDNSPVDPRFKKKECKGVSAKGIIVTTLAGDCFPAPPIGINLPNADWIRKEHGSKSVTITNLMDAYDKAANESPKSVLAEFAYSQDEIDLCKKYSGIADVLHTDLHECLGHGSGQLLPTTPQNALKEYSSALEEARADLFGLYYCADPKMVELGILPNMECYKAQYYDFIRNGLMSQLARIELGKDITEAHMQDRALISWWCYEKGLKDNVIEKKVRDGKTYFVINDFDKLRGLFGDLLAEIQRVKSEGDYEEGKNLIETYAVKIDPELHKEVKERYNALGLKPYGGFINPDIVPVMKDGKVVDYQVNYPCDFLKQHLDYGKNYSFVEENHDAPEHLVVDMLYDFIDGTLACGNAENAVHEVVKYINAHPEERVIYITDYHPANHSSFADYGGIWPVHCVQGTRGGAIHEAFYTDVINPANRPDPERNIFRKGAKVDEEQYSGFESVGPDGRMLSECVGKDLVISGIATEYCVKNTLMEFLNAGHNIELLVPGLGYVTKDGHIETMKELEKIVTVIE